MFENLRSVTPLLFGLLFVVPAFAADAPVAKVNGVSIAQDFADAFVAEQKSRGTAETPELKNAIREELIRRELILQEVKKLGLDKQRQVAVQAELAQQAVYIRAFIQVLTNSNPIGDQAVQTAYENVKAQAGNTEYKVRHILVEKEDEATAMIANLKKGARFDELARQSKDGGTRDKGGDVGWVNRTNIVKPLLDAVVALEKGKYSETPVKSGFGYHIVLLEDTRPFNLQPFDQVKSQIAQRLQQEQVQQFIDEIRAKAKVE